MEETLISAIEYSVANHLQGNAVFLAERLHAHAKSETSTYYLATAYLNQGKAHQALAVLKGAQSERNRYLGALAAFRLGLFQEAEGFLVDGGLSEEGVGNVPNGAAGLFLLGMICKKLNQRERAIRSFSDSLKINPFLWCSFETLTAMGGDMDPAEFFGIDSPSEISQILPHVENLQINVPQPPLHKVTPEITLPQVAHKPKLHPTTPSIAKSIVKRIFESASTSPEEPEFLLKMNPIFDTKFIDKASTAVASPFAAPKPKTTEAEIPAKNQRKKPNAAPVKNAPGPVATPSGPKKLFEVPAASSIKQPQKNIPKAQPTKLAHQVDVMDIDREMNKPKTTQPTEQPQPLQPIPQIQQNLLQGTVQVLTLFRTIGEGLRLLNQYACSEAILAFQKLPKNQYKTGWILCHVAKAYFEMVQYVKAKQIFEEVRCLEPYRTSYMELFSTILWHLKEEVQLSYLAQQLTEMDRNSAGAWCAVGNCFSLQKEHETALKFLKKAIQLDSDFTYAYTLSGHEYISSENWDKATSCFRNAIRLDPRHYNAWYGLGMIYYSQEKYTSAEYHFRKALQINPKSSVLYCYVGMVLMEQKDYENALEMLTAAIQIDPKNTLAQFKKAAVLVSLNDLDNALLELTRLKEKAPKEAPIYILMGKIYKKKNEINKAIKCYTTALDFDTKSANFIKNAISKLGNHEPDTDAEDETDLV
uniref:UDP-N-acetylglucosamine--peptide N-acetylglucosaminyltransferase SPINDLY n=1 Tax=Arcella intermedia TaxID=1963864 RepID=A0A6B2KZ77_9EUKA